MQSEEAKLQQTPVGYTLVPSAQNRADGTPRFSFSLPPTYVSDPGLAMLARLESEHAGFEFATRAFFDRHLASGDIFIDIGAHFGLYSMAAATLLPGEIKVVAFEPHPLNALSMLRQLGHNGLQNDIELVCSALGAEPSFGKLWPFSTMGNFISDERPKEAWADNPPLSVPILPLDLFLEKRPDLSSGRLMVKVDVEGFEPEVMAGMEGLFASGRIAAIAFEQSEFYADPLRWRAFEGMIQQLKGHGYRIYWFPHLHLPCTLIPWVAGNGTGNLMALSPEFEKAPAYDGPFVAYTPPPSPMKMEFSASDQRELTERLISQRASDGWRWSIPRNMDVGADARAKLAAPHISATNRILDLGAGTMNIVQHLKAGNTYTPVDLIRYAKSTVLADLNDGEFPSGEWDCALALELFEHVHDVEALLKKIRASATRLICTYECLEDVSHITARRQHGYFNDLDRATISELILSVGWPDVVVEIHGSLSLFVCE